MYKSDHSKDAVPSDAPSELFGAIEVAIEGAVRVTTLADELIPDVNAVPVPNNVYISEKLSLTLSPPTLSESPVPSSALLPNPID